MKPGILRALTCCVSLILALQSTAFGQGRILKAEMGTGRTENYEIVNPTTEFARDTPKIFCVWKTDGVKIGTTVRSVWFAEDVGNVAPPNYKLDEAALNLPLNQGSFTLSKPNRGWPPGKYRLEIYLGKDLAKTIPFTVRAK